MSRRLRPFTVTFLAVAALGFAACGDDDDGSSVATFEHEAFPFTFEYPDDFELSEEVTIDQALGAEAAETVGIGIAENDLIIVQNFTLQREITESNLQLAKREIDALLTQLSPDAEPSQETEVAGQPALTASDISVPSIEGGETSLTILFQGDQEYVLNCQSTPEHREEVAEACDMAVDTLTFE